MFQSTKEYCHNLGFSVAFRQWKAESRCRFGHGYSLAFKLVFEADELDHRGWVIDFGGLKPLKKWLEDTFDHKTLVASDDPYIAWFREGHRLGTIDMLEVEATGCEMFAKMVFNRAEAWLIENKHSPRVRLVSAEVKEHGANSAVCLPEKKSCGCSC